MVATLADVLADVLPGMATTSGGVGAAGAGALGPDDLAGLRSDLDAAAATAVEIGGWTPGEPLRLSKHPLRWLLTCPRRALVHDAGGDPDALAVGRLVDAAAKLAALGSTRRIDVDAALAFLEAHGDTTVADHLAARGEAGDALRRDAAARVARLVEAWPRVDPDWWPRVEEPVRVALAAGAVTLAGRLDVVLGGPPSTRPAVIVEIKAGGWHDAMRADAHLYALLAGLRDGCLPAAVVTLVADGTTQVEPVRAAAVVHMAERVRAALATAASLAAGEPAEARPGAHCRPCPVRHECDVGAAWLAADPAAARSTP
ncbi:MAG: PD-(D/E)XK nuclease family protein [Acidimicrobiia bacterium]